MFVVQPDVIINPLQVESVTWNEEALILDAQGKDQLSVTVRMASGREYVIDKGVATDVDEAVRQLVFQIDLANGMTIKKEKEEPEEEKRGNGLGKEKVKIVPLKKESDK